MNYKLKCAVQWGISLLPKSHRLNRFFQRHVSKSLPVSDGELDARREIALHHLQQFTERNARRPERILDIGSGADLSLPMLLAAEGAAVTASDVARLASPALIGDMLRRLGLSSLEAAGVSYVVYSPPRLPFPDDTFDLVTSTSVLEHVPADQLPVLLSEIRRVLKPDGIGSHHVAHKDHWSDADSSLHSMHYVRFGPSEWKRYNPPVMFQNRLMHSQYVDMIEAAGFHFDVVKTQCETPPPVVHPSFDRFPPDDLRTTHSWFVLSAPGQPQSGT